MGTSSIQDGCPKNGFPRSYTEEKDLLGHPSSIDDVPIKLIQFCYYYIPKFMSNKLI